MKATKKTVIQQHQNSHLRMDSYIWSNNTRIAILEWAAIYDLTTPE